MATRYVTWIDGQEAAVELLQPAHTGAICARIEVEGEPPREVCFDLLDDTGDGVHLLLPDGASRPARVAVGERETEVVVGGHIVPVRVMAERDAWLGDAAMGEHEGEVTVAMPGLVVKVMAAVGDHVEADTPVLIIEAMKMENEVKAGRAGVVRAVHVEAGAPVEADVVLMEIGDAD